MRQIYVAIVGEGADPNATSTVNTERIPSTSASASQQHNHVLYLDRWTVPVILGISNSVTFLAIRIQGKTRRVPEVVIHNVGNL